MTPDAAQQLVARAGEEIVCPRCGAVVAKFTGDSYGFDRWNCRATVAAMRGGAGRCRCGAATAKPLDNATRRLSDCAARGVAMMIHIRSGAWTGWRALGGE